LPTEMPQLADRVQDAHQTALRKISARCAEIGGVNLSQGICDLPTPDALKAGASQAITEDRSSYTHLAGIAPLRQAIAGKMKSFNNVDVDWQTELAVTVGAAGGFAGALLATLNPGDEVVLFSPFYRYYTDTLHLFGAVPRFVHTRAPDWRFSVDELAAAFSDRTRMILVNTPANPSGKVFTREELTAIARLAREHDAWILTDEVYEFITFDHPHVSIASLPDAAGRTITLSSASKTFAITGWRIGYAAGPADLIDKMLVVNDLLNICAPTPLQHGVLAGMHMDADYFDSLGRDYRAKRDMLADALTDAGLVPYVPQGAFYMMADLGSHEFATALDAAYGILERVGVAAVPGDGFYADTSEGQRQLRFCFAKKRDELDEACKRLRQLA